MTLKMRVEINYDDYTKAFVRECMLTENINVGYVYCSPNRAAVSSHTDLKGVRKLYLYHDISRHYKRRSFIYCLEVL